MPAKGLPPKMKGRLWFLLRLLLAFGLLAFVVRQYGGRRIFDSLAGAEPAWVLLGALSFLLSIALGAYQWHLLLRFQGIDLGYGKTFRTYYSGMFLNNFLPGTVGGDVLRVYEVHRSSAMMGKGAAATFLDRLIGFLALSLFSLLAVLYTLYRGAQEKHLFDHMLLAAGIVCLVFTVLLFALLSRRAMVLLTRLLQRFGFLRFLLGFYTKVQEACLAYRSRWGALGALLGLSLLVQALRIQVHAFSALSLSIPISPVSIYCFIPLIALAAVIPLNVGGWGIPQGLATYLYTLPGVMDYNGQAGEASLRAAAASLAFLPSVVGFLVMLGGGFFFIFRPGAPAPLPSQRRA